MICFQSRTFGISITTDYKYLSYNQSYVKGIRIKKSQVFFLKETALKAVFLFLISKKAQVVVLEWKVRLLFANRKSQYY